ncbi:MAG: Hippuricase, partial [Ramlibacter sp.]|nr:Hippuricase [Ramlibacter sp.]
MQSPPDITPYLGKLIQLRRDLHAHPELKFEENRTADRIAAYLGALGLPVHRGLGGTGVVATLRGNGPNAADPARALALRADMDALPVQEINAFGYASTSPGRMHACGHDGHTAMLLGGATLLAKRPDFDGTVHFIFQPGEEGGAGAQLMMKDGLFDKFPAKAVFALHNWPALPAGQMGVRVGPIMASANRFEIRVHGKGGHAAQPHTTV